MSCNRNIFLKKKVGNAGFCFAMCVCVHVFPFFGTFFKCDYGQHSGFLLCVLECGERRTPCGDRGRYYNDVSTS